MVALKFAALALTFLRALAVDIELPEGISVHTLSSLKTHTKLTSPYRLKN